jgi:ABC-type glycerol-3-phosphate transport system substrate-binding protein
MFIKHEYILWRIEMKKLFFVAVMAGLAVMVFSAGQQQRQSVQSGQAIQALDLSRRGSFSGISRGVVTAIGKNAVIDILSEKFNADISWDVRPSSNYNQFCQVTLASGDYPDVMEVWFSGGRSGSTKEIAALYEEGTILPLNNLLKQYGQTIEKERPYKECWFWLEDGERAAIPCRFNAADWIVSIRQDWLDNLGLKTPTNLDEVAEVARAFTFKDPDKNGKDDTIGFGGQDAWTSDAVMRIALAGYGITMDWEKVGNSYEPWEIRQGTREAIKWARDRYAEGVVDKDFMTRTRDQALERWNLNRYGFFHSGNEALKPSNAWNRAFTKINPGQKTVPFVSVAAKGYKPGAFFTMNKAVPPTTVLLIFSKTKEAPRIISMIDYLATPEGYALANFGPEGRAWDLVNETITLRNLTEQETLSLGVGALDHLFYAGFDRIGHTPEFLKIYDNQYKPNAVTWALPQIFPEYDGDRSALGPLANESLIKMVTEPNVDVDKAFAQFRREYLNSGGQAYIDYMTKQFNANLK